MLRMLAASAVLLALANASPVGIVPRQQCYSGVYMIVGRGSDEDAGEGKPGAVADLVQSAVPNSASVAVNYPATLTDPPYPTSVTDGINDVIDKVHTYVDACGKTSRIALIGYSQGGNVMTDVLAGGVDKPAPLTPAYAQYTVTVFGDPSFTVGQSFDVGNATKSGIFARGDSSLALLNTYASRVRSYCMEHDSFCASGDSLDTHYAEVATFENAAASFIIGKNQ